jgi:hypothetical protein
MSRLSKPYNKYFQKSRGFLVPVLGLKKLTKHAFLQSYLVWEEMYSLEDRKLILTYNKEQEKGWDDYLLNTLMVNQMFHEYHESADSIAISFDMSCIDSDYQCVIDGRYSKLSKLAKIKIRDYYGYNTAEYAYMESFLFPTRYISIYSKLLDVAEEHIRFTGELCDKPDFSQETLNLKPTHGEINDAHHFHMEQGQDFQDDSN